MARNLGSPTLSRLGVSRDLEIGNKATITRLGLGLVAEMNLVETRTGGGYMHGGRKRTGGESVMEVDSD